MGHGSTEGGFVARAASHVLYVAACCCLANGDVINWCDIAAVAYWFGTVEVNARVYAKGPANCCGPGELNTRGYVEGPANCGIGIDGYCGMAL